MPDEWFDAIERNDLELVSRLIPKNKGRRNDDGDTGLIVAVQSNLLGVAQLLAPHERGLRSASGCTALMIACMMNLVELTNVLLPLEYEENLSDGRDALMLAASSNSGDVIEYLAEKYLLRRDSHGLTALDYASHEGHLLIVIKLIALYKPTSEDLDFALEFAQRAGRQTVISFLVDLKKKTVNGYTGGVLSSLNAFRSRSTPTLAASRYDRTLQQQQQQQQSLTSQQIIQSKLPNKTSGKHIAPPFKRDWEPLQQGQQDLRIQKEFNASTEWESQGYRGTTQKHGMQTQKIEVSPRSSQDPRTHPHQSAASIVQAMNSINRKSLPRYATGTSSGTIVITGSTRDLAGRETDPKKLAQRISLTLQQLYGDDLRAMVPENTKPLIPNDLDLHVITASATRVINEPVDVLQAIIDGYNRLKYAYVELLRKGVELAEVQRSESSTLSHRAPSPYSSSSNTSLRASTRLTTSEGLARSDLRSSRVNGLSLSKFSSTCDVQLASLKADVDRELHNPDNTPLMRHIINGGTDGLIELLTDITRQRSDGTTALMLAAQFNHLVAIQYLTKREARMRRRDGATALAIALKHRNYTAAKLLTRDEGINITSPRYSFRSENGETALMKAVRENDLITVWCLLDKQSGLCDESGRTALMYAAQYGRPQCVELLLHREIDFVDKTGHTVEYYARNPSHGNGEVRAEILALLESPSL
ncbi:Ankyrin repeat protein 1 [Giardia muris]|uniref:Ankyrin repeat protein 1 n=1 Tax=Giardia muris TaxID=5742 RepID=A0A4Z1T9G1_GIAMU|nr:Ankyrin repeat protein 1 [Giardia muris]|eukprot:TNJ29161.1 Ankyrin repeat protein 1 [Giardia muris]